MCINKTSNNHSQLDAVSGVKAVDLHCVSYWGQL